MIKKMNIEDEEMRKKDSKKKSLAWELPSVKT